MKNIEILGSPDIHLLKSWLMPVLFGGLLVADYIASDKFNFITALCFLSWTILVAANRRVLPDEKSRSKYVLEFGDTALICKFKNATYWHIPYSNISHASEEEDKSGTIFLPKIKHFLIHTKDGDSFSIPIKINPTQIAEIKTAIAQLANA